MYYHGKGLKQDYFKAKELFEKAVTQSHVSAQFNLGVMYLNGKGVKQDKIVAKSWYGKACDNLDQQSCDAYKLLNEQGY